MLDVQSGRNSLFVHRNYEVVVAEHVVALCPRPDTFVVDAILPFHLLGKRREEVCIEKVHLIDGDIKLFEQITRQA